MKKNKGKQHQMYKWMGLKTVQHIHIFKSFSSSSANNLEVFFMFPQAKNKQESGITPLPIA